jgi:hypothetical protein
VYRGANSLKVKRKNNALSEISAGRRGEFFICQEKTKYYREPLINKSENSYTLFIAGALYYYLLMAIFTVFISHTFYILDFIAL